MLLENALSEDVAMLTDGDWHVEIVQRGKAGHTDHSAPATAEPYASSVENVLMDRGWMVREHTRPGFTAEADSPPEEGAFSLVVYPDGKITYLDWISGYSRDGHIDDPLLPHQLAESVELHASQTDS